MRTLTEGRLRLYKRQMVNRRWVLTREYWKEREGSLAFIQGDPEDSIDLAVRTYTRDFLLSLSELERNELRQIEGALHRLERGEFGRCLECGQRIPVGRLDAIPWATTCYSCQVNEEVRRSHEAVAVVENPFSELTAA